MPERFAPSSRFTDFYVQKFNRCIVQHDLCPNSRKDDTELRLCTVKGKQSTTPQQSKHTRLMQNFSLAPREMITTIWRNQVLIRALIKREVVGRYRGSVLGILWSFFNPVFMLVVYTFVFSVVFKARWNGGGDSKTEFALILFAGLMVFNLFAECVNRAPGLIISNINYVKKIIFPLEILPVVSFGAAIFHTAISFVVWLLFFLLFLGLPPITALLLPITIFPLMLFTLGLTWFLASLGVYLRDVGQFIGIIITALMFLSPIFYPVSVLPEEYQPFLLINPLTPMIEQVRDILIWGKAPDWYSLVGYFAASAVIAWLGFVWFQKTRKGFADVL